MNSPRKKRKSEQRAQSYLYASSRVRALENDTLSREDLFAMADASSSEELERMLCDASVLKEGEALSDALGRMWKETVEEIFSLVPEEDKKTFSLFLCPYACHNIKTALKGALGDKKTDRLLLFCPLLSPDEAKNAASERDFSLLPPHMADSAEKAVKAFETTKDPRMIDVLLDAGCFADMEEIAQTDPDPFFASYVEKKTDLVNLSIAARLLRTSEDTVSGMEEELLPGGSMRAVFLESIGEGKEAFVASLSRAGYAEIGNAIAGGASPSEIERMSDLILLDFTKEKADELYGPAIPAARLLTREAEIKNLRILSYGVESRIGGEEIRSRLRF